jgi:Mor family transcriptional regulator
MFQGFLATLKGVRPTSRHVLQGLAQAAWFFLRAFYHGRIEVTITLTNTERNQRIRGQYSQGYTIPELAGLYNLSNTRIHQILHGRRD